MKKLTKEQAEWLAEKMQAELSAHYASPFLLQVKGIINQCVEKDFPRFYMEAGHYEQVCVREMKCMDVDCAVVISTERIATHMSAERFKEFTDGCNKVVEWLEEHESFSERMARDQKGVPL